VSNAALGNVGLVVFVAYVVGYMLVGLAISRAWRAGRISTRTAALLRAGRWATAPLFVAATGGWLLTPLAWVLTASAFALSAALNRDIHQGALEIPVIDRPREVYAIDALIAA
jgi:hypothetical protein